MSIRGEMTLQHDVIRVACGGRTVIGGLRGLTLQLDCFIFATTQLCTELDKARLFSRVSITN